MGLGGQHGYLAAERRLHRAIRDFREALALSIAPWLKADVEARQMREAGRRGAEAAQRYLRIAEAEAKAEKIRSRPGH